MTCARLKQTLKVTNKDERSEYSGYAEERLSCTIVFAIYSYPQKIASPNIIAIILA